VQETVCTTRGRRSRRIFITISAAFLRGRHGEGRIGHLGWGQGVCAGDPDNDGHVDLFVTQWGHNVFLTTWETAPSANENEGAWPLSTGIALEHRSAPSSITTAMSYLDLVVANLRQLQSAGFASAAHPKRLQLERHAPCPAVRRGLKGETMTLYHNDGTGIFVDVTKQGRDRDST